MTPAGHQGTLKTVASSILQKELFNDLQEALG